MHCADYPTNRAHFNYDFSSLYNTILAKDNIFIKGEFMQKKRTSYLSLLVFIVTLSITACSNSTTISKEESQTITTSSPEIDKEDIVTTEESNTEEELKTEEGTFAYENNLIEFDITSTSLRDDGKWLSIITKSKGENKSPQLSWTPVENATCYGIYMFDTSAGNWLHWIAKDVTETELEMGVEIENSKYVGPYPPGGTHTYEITIFAFKASPDSYPGTFDSSNSNLDTIISKLDTSNGVSGNIIAISVLSGTYKSGDIVE
ncbi:MAG: hypothetical protein K0R15_1637 [Clostridiales bacterium]|jgi:phosphatidylethanolamine-binding protein (PEBP) family uncharacterized protein|nr:hypothetical protein [Clostridiales bacterium]